MKHASCLLILEALGSKPHFKEKVLVQYLWLSQSRKDPVVRSPVTVTESSSVVVPSLIWISCTVIPKSRKIAHLNTLH